MGRSPPRLGPTPAAGLHGPIFSQKGKISLAPIEMRRGQRTVVDEALAVAVHDDDKDVPERLRVAGDGDGTAVVVELELLLCLL